MPRPPVAPVPRTYRRTITAVAAGACTAYAAVRAWRSWVERIEEESGQACVSASETFVPLSLTQDAAVLDASRQSGCLNGAHQLVLILLTPVGMPHSPRATHGPPSEVEVLTRNHSRARPPAQLATCQARRRPLCAALVQLLRFSGAVSL